MIDTMMYLQFSFLASTMLASKVITLHYFQTFLLPQWVTEHFGITFFLYHTLKTNLPQFSIGVAAPIYSLRENKKVNRINFYITSSICNIDNVYVVAEGGIEPPTSSL